MNKKITSLTAALISATAFCGLCTGCASDISVNKANSASGAIASADDTGSGNPSTAHKVILSPGWYVSGGTQTNNAVDGTDVTAADGGTYFVDNAYVCNLAAGEDLPDATTTRSGMTFVGWRYASEGEIITVAKMPDVTKLESDLYLYAEWATSGSIAPDPDNPDIPVTTKKGGVYVNGQLIADLVGTDTECIATGVMLNPGDVVTIQINGTTLTHRAGVLELWHDSYRNPHGVRFDQDEGTFTVKSAGGRRAFTIGARYYTDGTPCWSIEFTDGLTDSLIDNGSYLVGSGWADGSWTISSDNYIDPTDGLIVTFTSTNAEFKICEYKSPATVDGENRVWNHNTPSHYSMAAGSSGLNFASISDSGNGKVTKLGRYKITVTGTGASARFVFEYLGE